MPHRNIKSSAAPCNSHSMMEPLFAMAVSVPAVHRYLQPCHVLLREVALVPLYLLKKTWWSVAGRFDFLLRWGGRHRLRCCGFLVLRRFRRFRRRRLWRRTLRLQSGKQILVPFAFFFPKLRSKMAGRSSLGIAGKAAICASVALMRPSGSPPVLRAPLPQRHLCPASIFRHVAPSFLQRRARKQCVDRFWIL